MARKKIILVSKDKEKRKAVKYTKKSSRVLKAMAKAHGGDMKEVRRESKSALREVKSKYKK